MAAQLLPAGVSEDGGTGADNLPGCEELFPGGLSGLGGHGGGADEVGAGGRFNASELLEHEFGGGALGQCLEPFKNLRPEAAMATPRMGIEDAPAAKGSTGRGAAEDKAITTNDGNRLLKGKLEPAFLAWGKVASAEQANPGHHLGSAGEKLYFHVMAEGDGGVEQVAIGCVEENGATATTGRAEHVTTPELADLDAGEVDGNPAAGESDLAFLLVGLEATDTGLERGRLDLDVVANMEGAADESAGDDGAKAGEAENAIYWEARTAGVGTGRGLLESGDERLPQVVDAGAGASRDRNDGGIGKNGAGQGVL